MKSWPLSWLAEISAQSKWNKLNRITLKWSFCSKLVSWQFVKQSQNWIYRFMYMTLIFVTVWLDSSGFWCHVPALPIRLQRRSEMQIFSHSKKHGAGRKFKYFSFKVMSVTKKIENVCPSTWINKVFSQTTFNCNFCKANVDADVMQILTKFSEYLHKKILNICIFPSASVLWIIKVGSAFNAPAFPP